MEEAVAGSKAVERNWWIKKPCDLNHKYTASVWSHTIGASLPPCPHLTLQNTEWWFWPRPPLVTRGDRGLGGPLRWSISTVLCSYVPLFFCGCTYTLFLKSHWHCAKPVNSLAVKRQGKNMDRRQTIGQRLHVNIKLRTGSRPSVQGQKPGARGKACSWMTAVEWCISFIHSIERTSHQSGSPARSQIAHPSKRLFAAEGVVWWQHYLGKLVALPTLPKLKAWSGNCAMTDLHIHVT